MADSFCARHVGVPYRYGPSRTEPRWRWITWGTVFAALVWLAASALFSWYVASFGSYNKTYGSLGAIIGFMTWIWISIIVVLDAPRDRYLPYVFKSLELKLNPDQSQPRKPLSGNG
jgi:Virulence factor BrkB